MGATVGVGVTVGVTNGVAITNGARVTDGVGVLAAALPLTRYLMVKLARWKPPSSDAYTSNANSPAVAVSSVNSAWLSHNPVAGLVRVGCE